jgi:hypothetical protein
LVAKSYFRFFKGQFIAHKLPFDRLISLRS